MYKLSMGSEDQDAGALVQRLCAERLAGAREALRVDADDVEEAVHDARKHLKKLRAVLRLAREGLSVYEPANRAARDAGRALSDLRDATVLVETARGLGVDDDLEAMLAEYRDTLYAESFDDARREALDELDDLAVLLDGLDTSSVDTDTFAAGVERTHTRILDALETIEEQGATDERLHELRKRVKYHRYHLRILAPAFPRVLRAWERTLHELTDLLGDDHDLAVLRDRLEELAETRALGQAALDIVGARLDERRVELQNDALHLADLCFGEPSEQVAARLARWAAAAL